MQLTLGGSLAEHGSLLGLYFYTTAKSKRTQALIGLRPFVEVVLRGTTSVVLTDGEELANLLGDAEEIDEHGVSPI